MEVSILKKIGVILQVKRGAVIASVTCIEMGRGRDLIFRSRLEIGLRLVISLIVLAKLILEQTNYHLMNAKFHDLSLIISYWSAEAIRDDRLRVMVFSRSQHNATEINYNQLYECVFIFSSKVL